MEGGGEGILEFVKKEAKHGGYLVYTIKCNFSILSLPQIYEEFYHTINNSDHLKDLKWWSNNHGVNMAMNWPSFVVSAVSAIICYVYKLCFLCLKKENVFG